MATLDRTPYLSYKEQFFLTLTTEQSKPSAPIFSRELGNMFRLVNFVVLSSLVALFGIGSNVINMIVFYRQGLTTTTNISFFALAMSDFMCLVTVEFNNIWLNPYLDTDDIIYIFREIQYLTFAWWHASFGRITSWITVFITAERCLSVALPLRVKQIITLRRTTLAMCLIFVVNISLILPEYARAYLDWKFVPAKNRTVFGLVYRGNTLNLYGLIYTLFSISGIMSFIFVIILTTFLVVSLERKSKWRKQATGGKDKSETMSSRDKKTMQMIIMIASVLIVCYLPGTVVSLVSPFVPEFMIDRAYENAYISLWSIVFVCNTINSSVNMFLYYRMSTKYRQTFCQLYPRFTKTQSIASVD